MSLDTFNDTPPPLFNQGPSALSRLLFFSALALLLMVADARLHVMQPLRAAISAVLYPAQWLALQPVQMAGSLASYLTDLKTAHLTEEAARRKLVEQSQRAGQVEQLQLENQRLRNLLGLRARVQAVSVAAQVLYDATDPYSRRVVIDKGKLQGIVAGSPVLDESGVLGQITRVNPFTSEITLLIDRDQVIPVMNARTGTRSVAYGDPSPHGGMMELRYMSITEDVKDGDLLTTSGVDGVYPPGLPVAKVTQVDHRSDSSFARIQCTPMAKLQGVTYVMVLTPVSPQPDIDTAETAAPTAAASMAMPAASAAKPPASAASAAAVQPAAAKVAVASAAKPSRRPRQGAPR